MYKGLYVAMTGATLRSQELDSVANNLANVSTAGYKKESFSSQLYPLLEGMPQASGSIYNDARAMTSSGKYAINNAEGTMRTTGNPLDLAIKGEGFFAVQGKGQPLYTRNGTFSRDKDGFLIASGGTKVLDTSSKPIKIEGNGTVSVSPDGTIFMGDASVGKLKIVKIDNARHVGDSLFSGSETGTASGEVAQGAIEASNVNPVMEMVGIINALREFEAAQKVIQSFDALAQRTVSEIAKV